jgi:hypothetical protein
MKPRDYLTDENQRNRAHAPLFEALLKRALGANWVVLTGHHFLYEYGGDARTEGEIPSADTVIFDHEIMTTVFGERAYAIMKAAAETPSTERDALIAHELTQLTGERYDTL